MTWWLPHSDIPGSKLARSSPGLFAACHVLHRRLPPRHPPRALTYFNLHLAQNHPHKKERQPNKRRQGENLKVLDGIASVSHVFFGFQRTRPDSKKPGPWQLNNGVSLMIDRPGSSENLGPSPHTTTTRTGSGGGDSNRARSRVSVERR
jgi:hypothetical protein